MSEQCGRQLGQITSRKQGGWGEPHIPFHGGGICEEAKHGLDIGSEPLKLWPQEQTLRALNS